MCWETLDMREAFGRRAEKNGFYLGGNVTALEDFKAGLSMI